MFEIKRQKKVVDFSYRFMRFRNYLYTKIRKAHDMLAGVFHLFFMLYFFKFCGFHETKNKQKRFFMSLKFNFAQTTIFYILFTTF